MKISQSAMFSNLSDVSSDRFPPFDLDLIIPGDATTHVVPAIPLEPAPRIIWHDPALFTPHRNWLARVDLKIIQSGTMPRDTERMFFRPGKPISGKFLATIAHVAPTENTEGKHMLRCQLRFEFNMKILPNRFGA